MPRKKVPKKDQKTRIIPVRVSEKELKRIKRYAKGNKFTTIAPLVRKAILDKIEEDEALSNLPY